MVTLYVIVVQMLECQKFHEFYRNLHLYIALKIIAHHEDIVPSKAYNFQFFMQK